MEQKAKNQIESPWLTVTECADYLRLKTSTIYSYLHQKKLRHYKLNGRRIYFKREDLDKFIMGVDNLNLCKTATQIEQEAINNIISSK
ncbi:MAG: helix-turn-helix domain-containing protein [Candidatus Cloacimonetes bacterium]|jgi:excisionase family DNA binding protein|nr:helix-turn-helix domain-containing protein [Candidatus Cloacimonadota bacterium]MBT4334159.1 helix-turn-helix domain-containing protein [Candidatus Cloacimonadota bacterium]